MEQATAQMFPKVRIGRHEGHPYHSLALARRTCIRPSVGSSLQLHRGFR